MAHTDSEAGSETWLNAASESCTRAGLTALLAASLSFTLIPAVQSGKSLEAYGAYLNARAELATALEDLEFDPCWSELIAGPHALNVQSFPISKLLLLQCRAPSSQPVISGLRFVEEAVRDGRVLITQPPGTAPNGAPIAPQLAYEQPIAGIWAVRDALARLNDPRIANTARLLSSEVDRAIYRWQSRAYGVRVMRSLPMITLRQEPSEAPVTDESVAEDTKALLDVLRIEDARVLSKHVPISDDALERAQASLWTGSLPGLAETPFRLAMAPSLLLALNALAMAWLWLSAHEYRVQAADVRPSGGVLMMFGRTFPSRLLFVVLLSSPPVAAVSLGQAISHTWWKSAVALGVVVLAMATSLEARAVWELAVSNRVGPPPE